MIFELWNHVSGNAIGEFETIAAALAAVRTEFGAHGQAYVEEWTLAVVDASDTQPIATGAALISLATGAFEDTEAATAQ